jgi:hypothetical protein
VAAVILAGKELACLWIDGDTLAIGPVPIFRVDGVSHPGEFVSNVWTEAGLEIKLVGQVLMMKPWCIDRLLNAQAAFGCG